MKRLILMALLMSIGIVYAQKSESELREQEKWKYPDTLLVHADKYKIEFAVKNSNHKSLTDSISNAFNAMKDFLVENKEQLKFDPPVEIIYGIDLDGKDYMGVKQIDKEKEFIVKFNEQYNIGNKSSISVAVPSHGNMKIYFDDIDDILNINIKALVSELKIKYPSKKKFSISPSISLAHKTHHNFYGDSLDLGVTKNNGSMHQIELSANYGSTLFKQTPTIDFGGTMSLLFSKKGILKYGPFLSYSIKSNYDFDTEKLFNNGFLSGGFRYNFSDVLSKSRWIGFESGYLLNRRGKLFDKDTYMFGISAQYGKFVISPQVYTSDNFKQWIPGLSIKIFGF